MDTEKTEEIKYPYAVAGTCRPGYRVGEFTLYDGVAGAHKVWIENGSGEGGDFDSNAFRDLIAQFYDENF